MERKPKGSETALLKARARVETYSDLFVVGWREWIELPELGIASIKAKVDTGARTSALHAYDIEEFIRHKKRWVRFKVHPLQRNNSIEIETEARVIEERKIKDSGGRVTVRPVIQTTVKMGTLSWQIELTLIDRSEMGFRMLVGREAVKGHLLVHPGKSYLIGTQSVIKEKRKPL